MEGYDFIPFPNTGPMVRRARRLLARHDQRSAEAWFGTLLLDIICHQPLHIGSGFKTEIDGDVIRRAAREGERLIIPGSTLKGVIRSRFEAITRSCVFAPPNEKSRIHSQSHPDVQRGRLKASIRNMSIFDARCGQEEQTCPACALFGFQYKNQSLKSRIFIEDFLTLAESQCTIARVPAQYGPRLHHLGKFWIDKSGDEPTFEIVQIYGRKFYTDTGSSSINDTPRQQQIEVAPIKTRFSGKIHLLNVDDAELGGLLAALGLKPETFLKVGAAKGHGFGRVVVSVADYYLRNNMRQPREPTPDVWRSAFEASPDRWKGGEDKLLALYQKDR